jgi:hypothetical protein
LHRRFGTAQRAFTLAPVVPSQDVTRYQARNMPKPQYDLSHRAPTTLTILFRALGLVVVGVVMIVIRRLTTLLHS